MREDAVKDIFSLCASWVTEVAEAVERTNPPVPSSVQTRVAFAPAFREGRWPGIGLKVSPEHAEESFCRHPRTMAAVNLGCGLSRPPLVDAADHVLLGMERTRQ